MPPSTGRRHSRRRAWEQLVGPLAHLGAVLVQSLGSASPPPPGYVQLVALAASVLGASLAVLAYLLLLAGLERRNLLRAFAVLALVTSVSASPGALAGELAELLSAVAGFWLAALGVAYRHRHLPPWFGRA
jgi:hypothetical protein